MHSSSNLREDLLISIFQTAQKIDPLWNSLTKPNPKILSHGSGAEYVADERIYDAFKAYNNGVIMYGTDDNYLADEIQMREESAEEFGNPIKLFAQKTEETDFFKENNIDLDLILMKDPQPDRALSKSDYSYGTPEFSKLAGLNKAIVIVAFTDRHGFHDSQVLQVTNDFRNQGYFVENAQKYRVGSVKELLVAIPQKGLQQLVA